ncbi:transcriptional regulator [Methanolobus halotolerans]|uniref:Transcriptional regulator n=1 Tax=Methanolobus halotolerans TaxID=2052935 RepID=A0A4E0QAR3_9EURY|nr:transcriptional regulator [Methanolobus halotolerans]
MKKLLLEVIFASEKRKNVLLLLNDGPKEMEYLLDSLETTRHALLPQIKILEEHYLIANVKDKCELTTIGEVIVDDMIPLLRTINVFDDAIDYWGTHNKDFIPDYLFARIAELGGCTTIETPIHEAFEEDKYFMQEVNRTKSLWMVTSFLYPDYKTTLTYLLSKGVDIRIVISRGLYEKLLLDNFEDFKYFIQETAIEIYQHKDTFDMLSFSLSHHAIMMRLLTNQGMYDNKRLLCESESVHKWGKDLFEHYLKDSTLITSLD